MTESQFNPRCICGETLGIFTGRGRKPKYCGMVCKRKADIEAAALRRFLNPPQPMNISCKGCGSPFTSVRKRAFCSTRCSHSAHVRKRYPDRKPAPPRLDNRCVCKGCGTAYANKRARSNSKEGSNYCSRDCAYKHQKQWQHVKIEAECTKVFCGECAGCSADFCSRNRRRFCSEKCRIADRIKRSTKSNAKRAAIRKEATISRRKTRQCPTCQVIFTEERTNLAIYCSKRCGKKRFKNYRKRARAAGVFYEYVNREKVFERDGWRCQICGKPTPRNRQGTWHPNAPELDHRVPFALGGPHSYANTQCSCKACNNEKGARSSTGQLPLFEAATRKRPVFINGPGMFR